MNIMIGDIQNCRYDLNGYIFFKDCHGNSYKMTAETALNITYTLFDSVGHSYKELEKIENEIMKDE